MVQSTTVIIINNNFSVGCFEVRHVAISPRGFGFGGIMATNQAIVVVHLPRNDN